MSQHPVKDTAGAASYMSLAESTLEKWRVSGRGPRFVKIGRAVRYRTCDLDDFLAQRVVASTSQQAA